MFLIGLGALLVLCGVLYMIRTAIWRGPLSGPDSSPPVRDTLEPPTRRLRFLGFSTNWPGNLLIAIGAISFIAGAQFLPNPRSNPPGLFFGFHGPLYENI